MHATPLPAGRAGTPRTSATRPADRHGERPPLLPAGLQAPGRVHADVRVPRLHGGTWPASRIRRTALLRPVLGARRPADRAARVGSGPAPGRTGAAGD